MPSGVRRPPTTYIFLVTRSRLEGAEQLQRATSAPKQGAMTQCPLPTPLETTYCLVCKCASSQRIYFLLPPTDAHSWRLTYAVPHVSYGTARDVVYHRTQHLVPAPGNRCPYSKRLSHAVPHYPESSSYFRQQMSL